MKSDIEIARSIELKKIKQVAESVDIPRDEVENYGRYIAKIPTHLIDEEKVKKSNLILVTAITATKAGIGKTTVSIGLALGLNKIGKKAIVALREPSLGPCFGMKGGAAGGGYAQVLPMEKINLHFTGDFHAITSAHNMISALLDNYLYQHQADGFGLKEIIWRRVLDVNDRSLRSIVTGLGPSTNGITEESGFDITPASEIMAILCLATDLDDLRRRIENIILGFRFDGTPFTVKELGVAGAITVLLKDAINPNLVQTTEGSAAFVHGGPFANIAHGCNSIVSTNMADAIAKEYNVKLIEVLTGFKFIGEQIKFFEQQHTYEYEFGFEESYGCLIGTYARDKDAIVATMALCEAAAYYKTQGKTLWDAMIEMYEQFGYYKDAIQSVTMKGIEGLQKIQEIMNSLRQNPPAEFAGHKVTAVRDYKADTITDVATGAVKPTGLPNSNVLYYELTDDAWVCVRPSGTEPKVKFYYGVKGTSLADADEKSDIMGKAVLDMVDSMK